MKKYFIILFLLALAIFISGCIGFLTTPGDDSITPGKGRLEIYLTDSSEKYKANVSENYLAVNITISRIEAHIAGDDEGFEGYWVVLKDWLYEIESELIDELPVFDLIELKDKSILLSEKELVPGKYTQIRLFITEANVWIEIVNEESEEKIVSDSDVEKDIIVEPSEFYEEYNLEIPSNLQTGLKLIHPFEIIEGETIELAIDFDAEKSIIKTGNGSYKLKPVIKIVTISAEETEEPVGEYNLT